MSEPCHALVFRDVRERVSLAVAVEALEAELRSLQSSPAEDVLLNALLRSGEVDAALSDEGDESLQPLTHFLARVLMGEHIPSELSTWPSRLRDLGADRVVSVSRPEGFAFYGLHPLDYSDAVKGIPFDECNVVVIGIRSIGTTLGAVVAETIRARSGQTRKVESFTVRPQGHPYDRRCSFSDSQQKIIRECGPTARFLVVDEGPGLSGSSFLSVGEALVNLGVDHSQILFLCSREPKPERLVSPNGTARWRRFAWQVAPQNHSVQRGDLEYVGLGRYGEAVVARANALAAAGFTSPLSRAANGFAQGVARAGRRLTRDDISTAVLDRMAKYLACRVQTCNVPEQMVASDDLEQMARFNLLQATGTVLPADFCLQTKHAVIADGQMMPYAWLLPGSGELLKLDCAAHGDNHYFPGPIDIAWDFAGAIIEWDMDHATQGHFLTRYRELTHDDPSDRIHNYKMAYAAFRNAYCRMAASAMAGDTREAERLQRDARIYREVLQELQPVLTSVYE